ncbi:hypothetical protein C7B61_20780 [filamentous cyanobacterium CCP1]|nr:hypothetical protein C7B76_15310 [filamentous cyanobacterium CCP2]PSB56129.1 hypothetical protein C7B61_20780 [filamentous cyanobacterium CCP1]
MSTTTTIAAQILQCQVKLLDLYLHIEAMLGVDLVTDPWKGYKPSDYDSPEKYCRSCLIDLNNGAHYQRDASLCYLPIKAPRQSNAVYLEALFAAQEALLNPKNEFAYGNNRLHRISAADVLVSILQDFGQTPKPELVELSQSE